MASINGKGRKVYVIGVGLTKFEKPGARAGWDYPDMGAEAIVKALGDAGVPYSAVQSVTCGYVYGDTCAGQRALYKVGMTGVPVFNVNNACSTGSSALFLGRQMIAGGLADCVLAFGFEKMAKGSLSYTFQDRSNPLEVHLGHMNDMRGVSTAPFAAQMFGNAGREHMEKYGTTKEQFAKVAYKNHKHSKLNPYAQFRTEYSLEQILKSPDVYDPLTKLQCCPTSDGGGAAVLASEDFVKKHGLQSQAVEIVGMSMRTDIQSSFDDQSCIKIIGFDMSTAAAKDVYEQSGKSASDCQVVEVHDCFSCNELLTYEALGLCEVGKGGKLVDDGQVTYGGKWVVNPSGGLISKGHPLGATGFAQCAELCWQVRRMCGERQVKDVKYALQHNIGLGGAAVVTMYSLGFPDQWKPFNGKINPAIEATIPEMPPRVNGSPVTPIIPSSSSPQTPQKKAPVAATGQSSSEASPVVTAIFASLEKRIAQEPTLIDKVKSSFGFEIISASGKSGYTVDLKSGSGSPVSPQIASNVDVTLILKEEDFVALMNGKLDAQNAFMQGKLKIKGNMGAAMKLKDVISGAKAKL
jgi:sterol carrier protein 2